MNTKSLTLMLVLLAALALVGCSGDDPAAPTSVITAEKDAAAAIAADLGADDGGLMDQLSDAVGFAGAQTMFALQGGCEGLRDAVYDADTGTWTITVQRERGDPEGVPYASFTRVYTLRFLDADGLAQQRYVVESDTARTIEFAILSGEGVHRTLRLEHNLLALEGEFTVANANEPLVTINGRYHREGRNVLEVPRFLRTHESTLDLELLDVVAPRGAGRDLAEAVSGTVTGTYAALITVQRGDDYTEREILREFTVELGGGEGLMTMEQNAHRYRARLRTGELVEE